MSEVLLVAACLTAVAFWIGWRRERRARSEIEVRVRDMDASVERLSAARAGLRAERRRVRKSNRLKRRAQRVLGMVRVLVGPREAREVARRGTRAIVDGFGARRAHVWSLVGEQRVLLAEAVVERREERCRATESESKPGESAQSEPTQSESTQGDRSLPGAVALDQPVKTITLRDEERRPVAELQVEFRGPGEAPIGLAAYAAILGAVLGTCDERRAVEVDRDPVRGVARVA